MDELELIREFRHDQPVSGTAADEARRRLDRVVSGAARPPRRWRPAPGGAGRWATAASAAACVAVAAVAVAVALPGRDSGTPRARDEHAIVYGDALSKFPDQTASDVVSYADQVAVVTAVSQTEIPDEGPPERVAAGESVVNRRVTFRVDDTLWQRRGAPAPPETFEAVWWGWVTRDHQRTRFAVHGATWIEVGSRYVMPIAYDEGAVAPLQPLAVFPLRDGAVALSPGQGSPLAQRLSGAAPAVVAAVFASATPDPAAARHMDLPPTRRLEAVAAER